MLKGLKSFLGLILLVAFIAACEQSVVPEEGLGLGEQANSATYLVSSKGKLSAKFASFAASRGDTLSMFEPQAGFAAVQTNNPKAYKRFADIVVKDTVRVYTDPVERVALDEDVGNPPTSGDDDVLFDLQWGHDAVNAPEAWNAGVRGAGVRVAVLDGGFDTDHPDLAPNNNAALNYDATGQGLEYGDNCNDVFSHGAHVAGTIGAADNGLGTIGVAPEVELVFVKVLEDVTTDSGCTGSGSFEDVVEGIIYAADIAADVINMSLGADIPQRGDEDQSAAEVAALRKLMNRAMNYANQKGTTIIVAAGNDGRDLNKDKSLTVFPAEMPHAISISALGPEGWGADPDTDLETLAVYSNYGTSGIDFGAPGGDFELLLTNEELAFSNCTVAGLTRPCYVFDFVFSTGNGSWYWSVGTSMAAPHAAGIAALIISENGGDMKPAQVRAEMARRAADLGKSGKDAVYGRGAVRSGY